MPLADDRQLIPSRDREGAVFAEYETVFAKRRTRPFVALASAALFLGVGQSVKGIWNTANIHASRQHRRQLAIR
jgi:hypothetical protein